MRFFLLAALIIICPCAGVCDLLPLPPYYDAIMKIMAPLEYSGVPVMVKPQVALSVDFNDWTWTLRNIH
jgi:hypothetical protein